MYLHKEFQLNSVKNSFIKQTISWHLRAFLCIIMLWTFIVPTSCRNKKTSKCRNIENQEENNLILFTNLKTSVLSPSGRSQEKSKQYLDL